MVLDLLVKGGLEAARTCSIDILLVNCGTADDSFLVCSETVFTEDIWTKEEPTEAVVKEEESLINDV